jgi:3',5'-cyclic AMP phosphodiesterase CpdA
VTYVPGIILYPALLTPLILTQDQDLELLMLGNPDRPITPAAVSLQLKVDNQLNARKRFQAESIPLEWITVTSLGSLADSIVSSRGLFKGLVDRRARNLFNDHNYTQLYRVEISSTLLTAGIRGDRSMFNLIWIHYPGTSRAPASAVTGTGFPMPVDDDVLRLSLTDVSDPTNPRLIANELHDQIIWETLDCISGPRIPEKGKYCFRTTTPSAIDRQEPVQSYHPVFYFRELNQANIGHISDVHLCARQHLMHVSRARVIEFSQVVDGTEVAEDLGVSPPLGPIVNINSTRLAELFAAAGNDDDVDIVLIGGDLVDYIKSLYVSRVHADRAIPQIWDLLDLGTDYENHYQDYVDFVHFYTLLIGFYRAYKKPAFVVTGNHDAYYWPYGISPRAYGIRANEGIPADHNLTIYEAILLFGETYSEIKAPGVRHVNFQASRLNWFYTVLTPFSDFAAFLPQQCIVGLAWGEQEDLVGLPGDAGQGWGGHLPRSDDAISDSQLRFYETVDENKGDRKVILATHFTFVSYAERISAYPQHEGDVEFDSGWNACEYDMGTFETNRQRMYEYHLAQQRDVQLVLTGHSHRKALYSIVRIDYSGDNSVKTGFFELNDFGLSSTDAVTRYPAIILSDSGGPIPRCNKAGELLGRGSDRPSGTKVLFDSSGAVGSLALMRCNCVPRFVVAVDYVDLVEGSQVISQLECVFPTGSEIDLSSYSFHLELSPHIRDLASVAEMHLYVRGSEWHKTPMRQSMEHWVINDGRLFRQRFARGGGVVFIAIRFAMNPERSDRLSQYDFSSFWCFPVTLRLERAAPGVMKYSIVRDAEKAEIPDFDWLRENLEAYASH